MNQPVVGFSSLMSIDKLIQALRSPIPLWRFSLLMNIA